MDHELRPESRNDFIVLKEAANDVNSFYMNNSKDVLAEPEEIQLITDLAVLRKKRRLLLKNLLVIGFGWIFQFTAYTSISNLQSSLNSDDGLGTISLSVIYVSIILSCIFLPSALIKQLGVKWTILLSQAAYLLYIAANLYPRYYTLLPAAIILGAGAAVSPRVGCHGYFVSAFDFDCVVNSLSASLDSQMCVPARHGQLLLENKRRKS